MIVDEVLTVINLALAKEFKHFKYEGNTHFFLADGSLLKLSAHVWDGEELIIAEYADNFEECEKGRFEDGDVFYLSDWSPAAIVAKILEYES